MIGADCYSSSQRRICAPASPLAYAKTSKSEMKNSLSFISSLRWCLLFSLLFLLLISTVAQAGRPPGGGLDSCGASYGEGSGCTIDSSSYLFTQIDAFVQDPNHMCDIFCQHNANDPIVSVQYPSGVTCRNPCEYCCDYWFRIINYAAVGSSQPPIFKKIKKVELCTDRGCRQSVGPQPPLTFCTVPPPLPTRPDHICDYCGVSINRSGVPGSAGTSGGITWGEWGGCPRVLGNPTLADTWNDSLCRTNCLRVESLIPADYVGFEDTMWVKLGLTGDCHAHSQQTDLGSEKVKCIWFCVTYDDNTQYCCLVKVRHCYCINDEGCNCDPKDCDEDDIIAGGGGSSLGSNDIKEENDPYKGLARISIYANGQHLHLVNAVVKIEEDE